MKTILVTAGGGPKDETVFATALALAKPFSSHLDFYHVKPTLGEAASTTPHSSYAIGSAIAGLLRELQAQCDARSHAACQRATSFCKQHDIAMAEEPPVQDLVTASWREETGDSLRLFMRRTRHSDLVVVGRHTIPNGLPADLIELLLFGCGRPIVIAPSSPPCTLTGTVMVCWKECAEAAHALSAAMPLLSRAERVVIVSAWEGGDKSTNDADGFAQYFKWHRIKPEFRYLTESGSSTPQVLLSAARECRADLVVMGGYGRSRMREIVLGGCTETFVHDVDETAIFLVH